MAYSEGFFSGLKHPHHLAHVTLATLPSKATSPGKVVPLKSYLARFCIITHKKTGS